MEAAAYRELVESSAGHSHAGATAPSHGNSPHSMEESMHGEHNDAKPSTATEPGHMHKEGEQH